MCSGLLFALVMVLFMFGISCIIVYATVGYNRVSLLMHCSQYIHIAGHLFTAENGKLKCANMTLLFYSILGIIIPSHNKVVEGI